MLYHVMQNPCFDEVLTSLASKAGCLTMRPPPEMAAFTVDARAHVTKETTSNAVLLTQRLQDDSGIVCWNG